jgi:GTPase involved in cell partitioning and DNA repair
VIRKKAVEKESTSTGVVEINHEDDIILVAAGGSAGIGNKSMSGSLTRQKKSTVSMRLLSG